MNLLPRFSASFVNRVLAGVVLAQMLAAGIAIGRAHPPVLTVSYSDSEIVATTDRAWTLLPGECRQIRWEFDGSLSVHVDGREWHESGEQPFCPKIFAASPLIELTDHRSGVYLSDSLKIYYLPDVVANVLGLGALAFLPLTAAYYLWTNSLDEGPALRTLFLGGLALCLCIAILRLQGWPLTIVAALSILRGLFTSVTWQIVGVALVLVLYIPLAFQALRQGLRERRITDFVVVGSFLLFCWVAAFALWIRDNWAMGGVVRARLHGGLLSTAFVYGD